MIQSTDRPLIERIIQFCYYPSLPHLAGDSARIWATRQLSQWATDRREFFPSVRRFCHSQASPEAISNETLGTTLRLEIMHGIAQAVLTPSACDLVMLRRTAVAWADGALPSLIEATKAIPPKEFIRCLPITLEYCAGGGSDLQMEEIFHKSMESLGRLLDDAIAMKDGITEDTPEIHEHREAALRLGVACAGAMAMCATPNGTDLGVNYSPAYACWALSMLVCDIGSYGGEPARSTSTFMEFPLLLRTGPLRKHKLLLAESTSVGSIFDLAEPSLN